MTEPSASGVAGAAAQSAEGYAGDVDVEEAWRMLKDDPSAVLVDVRTTEEWSFVGVPDLSEVGKEVRLVEWQTFRAAEMKPSFIVDIAEAVPDHDVPVLLLCRSGGRSKAAAIALTAVGYARCYNVSGGFEGPHDADRHRGTVEGWKARGLPWVQG